MKALLLDGRLTDNFNMVRFSLMEKLEKEGFEVEPIVLREVKIAACQGCFECWVKTPGECKTEDYGQDIAEKIVNSDLIIHFTPITFGGYSSELKKALDRFIPTILPFFTKRDGETHHTYRYNKRGSIIAIGLLNEHDDEKERIFKELVFRNSLNMGAPIHEAIVYSKEHDESDFIEDFSAILKKVEART